MKLNRLLWLSDTLSLTVAQALFNQAFTLTLVVLRIRLVFRFSSEPPSTLLAGVVSCWTVLVPEWEDTQFTGPVSTEQMDWILHSLLTHWTAGDLLSQLTAGWQQDTHSVWPQKTNIHLLSESKHFTCYISTELYYLCFLLRLKLGGSYMDEALFIEIFEALESVSRNGSLEREQRGWKCLLALHDLFL